MESGVTGQSAPETVVLESRFDRGTAPTPYQHMVGNHVKDQQHKQNNVF